MSWFLTQLEHHHHCAYTQGRRPHGPRELPHIDDWSYPSQDIWIGSPRHMGYEPNLYESIQGRVHAPGGLSRWIVMKLTTASDKATLISMKAVLKGTKIYLNDDLTILQQEHKREGMKQVMTAKKWEMGYLS